MITRGTATEVGTSAWRDDPIRFLAIVAKNEQDVFVRVTREFLDDPRVCVLRDRRRRERRQRSQEHEPDRRRADRRHPPDYWEDLRHHAVVIVPIRVRADSPATTPTASTPPVQRAAIMEVTDATASATPRIDQWAREGTVLIPELIRVMPAVFEECDSLRQRLRSAEEHAHRLQAETTRLQAEVDRLQRVRAEALEAVEAYVAEIGRLTDTFRLKVTSP